MQVSNITNTTSSAINERVSGKRVILIYPWANYRTIFLTYFLETVDRGLLYYCIRAESSGSLVEWMSGLLDEFSEVLTGFGDQLRAALAAGKPDEIGAALAADLAAYSGGEDVILFLDDFDLAPLNGALRDFINAVVTALPDNVKLAFSSRRLTYEPWYGLVARDEATVLGTEYRKNDVMFAIESKPRPQLEVYALGRGYAIVNGQYIENWDGALPRNLFFYFMDHPLVTRDEIFQTFWPNLSVKEATNVFHVTKRKISERISMKVAGAGNYELTQYSGGFYMPSEKVVRHYDVADFQDAIDQAMVATSDEKEKALLTQAIELYKSPFLTTVDMQWVQDRREQLRQLYAQALISMARLHKRHQELPNALGFFIRALKETPEREDIHREVMNIYLQQDMVQDAIRQYQTLEKILKDELGIKPAHETRDLFETIKTRV
jgi:DNA-binding SARP family transcriptional activator